MKPLTGPEHYSSHLCINHFKLRSVLLSLFIISSFFAKAQKVESIYVNLYTDSLKKGTYNYINVDGLMSNGKYLPLDSTKIIFSCSEAKFYGNSLFIPNDFTPEKVTVKVKLREDETKHEEFVIWIKKKEDPPLRSQAEVLADMKARSKSKN